MTDQEKGHRGDDGQNNTTVEKPDSSADLKQPHTVELPKIRLTVFANNQGPVTKRYSLKNGKVERTTAAQLARGSFKTETVNDLTGFAELLATLETNQALGYGLADKPAGEIVTKDKVDATPGAIARSKDYFMFRPAPGIFMGDYDADHLPGIDSYDDLRDLLISACPALADAPALSKPSASSCIVNTETGEVISGLKGQRFYIAVKDSADIPRAGDALVDRLWLIGVGQYVVSPNGKRTPTPSIRFLSIGSQFMFHASFPHSVALMQLRFTSFVVINLRRDLHPQECAHAGRTTQNGRRCGARFFFAPRQCEERKKS